LNLPGYMDTTFNIRSGEGGASYNPVWRLCSLKRHEHS
jgi:hypothetical protein